ncbi:MAG: UDP-N-acetyl-D-glucosamine dehydrogenase [Legionellales bacterium RIFCSPHIGHO2_12_FULL_35_11]|nr:MAG: UDP-N-acetyl-D-glucosamine dehydrogenase [Legionellales bacterium RIFCSPHIGHO2_12_FULL_35_11]
MNKLKCAVIGVGYLGRFHAQKYQMLNRAELIGVCDVNQETSQKVANELNVVSYNNFHNLFDKVDAVSIAATTTEHYNIAKEFLARGIHTLIEKPMTRTVSEANELINIAKKSGAKLQIGHLERFNAARLAVDPFLKKPLFIESQRLATFNPRGADVNVILDLMIHDIDIIQNMVKSPVLSIEAEGAPVLSSAIDVANARITFENHCVANVSASRASLTTERKTKIFQKNSFISIDYHKKQFTIFERGKEEMFPGIPNIIQKETKFGESDALLTEINAFVEAILQDTKPLVTGEDGCEALAIAAKISEQIEGKLSLRYEQL